MDRFSETLPTSAHVDRDEDGYSDVPYSAAGHICQNCNQAVDRVTLVPEYEYYGCDDCMEEALAVIARETAELLERAGCTVAETAAWMSIIEERVA